MNEGTVVWAPHEEIVVVQHGNGFAVIEIIDDGTGIGCGDALRARSWEGLGTDTLYRGNVPCEAMFWRSHDRLEDAQEQALGFVFNLYETPSPLIH